jgi:hypothetical protein
VEPVVLEADGGVPMSYPVGTRVFISRQSPVLAGCMATVIRVLPYPHRQYLCKTHSGRDARVPERYIDMSAPPEIDDGEEMYLPDAALRAGCASHVIQKAIKAGDLAATKEGRGFYKVRVRDLDEWRRGRGFK